MACGIGIAATLNETLDDHFFNETWLLSYYFYLKLVVAVIAVVIAVWMRDYEIDKIDEEGNELEGEGE